MEIKKELEKEKSEALEIKRVSEIKKELEKEKSGRLLEIKQVSEIKRAREGEWSLQKSNIYRK